MPQVLAVHPLPTAGRQSRKRPPGSQRLPLHLAMTQTAQLQKDRLAAAAAETMTKMQAAMEASAAPREAPAGHDLLLFVHGRVLSGPQLKAAACCVASEAEGAKAAHAGASWRVPTVEPLVKEPSGLFPPPAPGHSDKGQPWPDAEPGFAAAVSILTDVILDAVASPQLAAALRELEEEEIPRFAQVLDRPNEVIRKAGETEPAEPVEVAKPLAVLPPPIPAAESFAPPTDDSRANRAEGSHREGEGEEPAGDGELGDGAEEEERAALARVAHPEIQVFMEFVLENAIYGLIQESILDDWEPLGLEEDQEEEVRRGEDYEGPAWDSRGVRYA